MSNFSYSIAARGIKDNKSTFYDKSNISKDKLEETVRQIIINMIKDNVEPVSFKIFYVEEPYFFEVFKWTRTKGVNFG